jgi:hypothetical protein
MIGQGLGRVAQAEKLSIQQLEEALENRTIPAYIGIPLLEEKVQIEQRMKMAQAGQMAPPEMTIADQVMGQARAALRRDRPGTNRLCSGDGRWWDCGV